jgi:4-amino-4-deoxy-L-arabinose transferase-like glycosyltransferase
LSLGTAPFTSRVRITIPEYSNPLKRFAALSAPTPGWMLFPLLFILVAVSHLTLLRLPYFWDEGGYYIPAALDFYHHGWLVPHFTNAHPPLPNVILGLAWRVTGFHILATRLIVCAFAAAGLLAVLRLGQRLVGNDAAIALTLLTAVYPIWYAQSTLAHADIFSAAFTLWGFAIYLRESLRRDQGAIRSSEACFKVGVLFALAALAKETAIVQPAALAALELILALRDRCRRGEHLRWLAALSFPLLPLVCWYIYHHHVTGFTFGNPEFLRYNATANFTVGHVFTALRYRFLHLFWQRQIWLPIVVALACFLLPLRDNRAQLSMGTLRDILVLIAANWLAFSVLGGALLTRYLLPVYPLILLLCIDIWHARTRLWPIFAAVTTIVFISAWWLDPPTSFAPEDNLTYRNMIVVHQEAIDYVAQHYPNATVLTAWPVTADIFNPYLGYVTKPMKPVALEDFTRPSIEKIAADTANTNTARYDTAIVFTTHFLEPGFRRWLEHHPDTLRGKQFAREHDLTPQEIAALLGGQVVWQDNRRGEWAAVLRFNRSYEARLR